MKKLLLFITLLAICHTGRAQSSSVGIGTINPDASAQLDISSNNKGVLLPRMTTAQRNAISSPASGLQVYNTDNNCMEYWNGTAWISSCGSTVNGAANLDCSGMQPSGVYQAGYTTTSANYITVPVNVVTPGSWTANTNTQNGITFTGGGVFSAPGPSSIILYATSGVTPASNGSFTYTLTLGSATCNFNINYNSLPACPTPSPALVATGSTCAIPLNSSKAFTVTGGTANTTAFTYSITPSSGVSAPAGTVSSGATPGIAFTTPGNYTITYKAVDSLATCAASSITASQNFSVSNQGAPSSSTVCTSHIINSSNLPAAGSSFTTAIGAVNVTVTRQNAGSGNIATSFTSPSCANAISTTSAFYLNGAGTTMTLTFSQPVKDLSFFGGSDLAGDSYNFTALNGTTDVSSSLVFSKLCPAQAFTVSNCNGVSLSTNNSNGQALNIGGVYYTSLTITMASGTDLQFDFGTCNASSNGCSTPSPALAIANTATCGGNDVTVGGSKVFSVTGGTSNATSYSYSISPVTGVSAPSGTVTGGVTPSISFTTAGSYTITFTATNTCGTGNPNSISASTSFNVAPLAAAGTTTICSTHINAANLPAAGSVYATTIAGVPVTITRSGYVATGSYVATAPSCAGAVNTANSFQEISGNGNMTFTFSQPVSNITLFSSMDVTGDNLVITAANGSQNVTSSLQLTKLCAAQNFNISNCNRVVIPASNQTGQAVNIGGVYFTSLTLNMTGQDIQFDFGTCNATSSVCPSPTALATTYSNGKNIATGASTTATASATNATNYSWTITPLAGTYTGATTGTGASTTITSSTWAIVSVTSSAVNNCGTGSASVPITKTDTVWIVNTPAAPANTICSTLPNPSAYPVSNTISGNTVTTSISGTNNSSTTGVTSQCGINFASVTAIQQVNGNSTTYSFSKPVSNISVLTGNDEAFESEGLTVTATLGGFPVALNLTKYGGTCNSTFTISGSTIRIPTSTSTTTSAIYFDVSGAYFDKLTVSRVGTTSGNNLHKLGYCNAVATP